MRCRVCAAVLVAVGTVVMLQTGDAEERQNQEQKTPLFEVWEDGSKEARSPTNGTEVTVQGVKVPLKQDFNGRLVYKGVTCDVLPVNDDPVFSVISPSLQLAVGIPHELPLLANVSSGPATATDEDSQSLFSPLSCTFSNPGLFLDPPTVELFAMQYTITQPTTAHMVGTPLAKGYGYLECYIRDTEGGYAKLPDILLSVY